MTTVTKTIRVIPDASLQHEFDATWDAWQEEGKSAVPPLLRRLIEKAVCNSCPRDYDLSNLADKRDFLGYFDQAAEEVVNALHTPVEANPGRKPHRVPKLKLTGKPPVREKNRERNARILAFVAERVMPFKLLMDGKVRPGRIGRGGVPWQKLFEEWNQVYSHRLDQFDSWTALRRAYYRAAANPYLAQEFLTALQESATGAMALWFSLAKQWNARHTSSWAAALKDGLGKAPLAVLKTLAEYTDECKRLHHARQQRTRSLPPLSDKYRRSKEYNRALSKQQKARARKG